MGCLLWTLLVGTLVVGGPQGAGTRQPPKVLVRVIRAAFSPDNTRLLTAVWRGKKALSLWDVQSGKELLRFGEHGQMVGFVNFTPDGKQVLAGSRDGVLRTYALPGGELVRTLRMYKYICSDGYLSRNGTRLLTLGLDQRVGLDRRFLRLWDLPTGRLVWEAAGITNDAIAFSPDSSLALIGPLAPSVPRGHISLWEMDAKRSRQVLKNEEHWHTFPVAFAPDSRTVLLAKKERKADGQTHFLLWDAKTEAVIKTLQASGYLLSAGFTPDGKQVVGVEEGQTRLRFWDVVSGRPVKTVGLGRDGEFREVLVVLSADRTLAMTASGYLQEGREGYQQIPGESLAARKAAVEIRIGIWDLTKGKLAREWADRSVH